VINRSGTVAIPVRLVVRKPKNSEFHKYVSIRVCIFVRYTFVIRLIRRAVAVKREGKKIVDRKGGKNNMNEIKTAVWVVVEGEGGGDGETRYRIQIYATTGLRPVRTS